MIRYRDNMTPAEEAAFLAELDRIGQAYAEAAALDEARAVQDEIDAQEAGAEPCDECGRRACACGAGEVAELRRAALDSRGRP